MSNDNKEVESLYNGLRSSLSKKDFNELHKIFANIKDNPLVKADLKAHIKMQNSTAWAWSVILTLASLIINKIDLLNSLKDSFYSNENSSLIKFLIFWNPQSKINMVYQKIDKFLIEINNWINKNCTLLALVLELCIAMAILSALWLRIYCNAQNQFLLSMIESIEQDPKVREELEKIKQQATTCDKKTYIVTIQRKD